MGYKRGFPEMTESTSPSPSSSFTPMFEEFRRALDDHHDRRERVIKASRDITAASKKIIFALQRIHNINLPIESKISQAIQAQYGTIENQYKGISPDLQRVNAHRYAHNITGGNQELIEAASFQRYIESQTLLSYDEACTMLAEFCRPAEPIMLAMEDYILGLFDMVGELMRFAITAMAMSGVLPGSTPQAENGAADDEPSVARSEANGPKLRMAGSSRDVLTDLREFRLYLEAVTVAQPSTFATDVEKKKAVMRNCVDKVENAVYGLMIRGRERPKGWVPEIRSDAQLREEY